MLYQHSVFVVSSLSQLRIFLAPLVPLYAPKWKCHPIEHVTQEASNRIHHSTPLLLYCLAVESAISCLSAVFLFGLHCQTLSSKTTREIWLIGLITHFVETFSSHFASATWQRVSLHHIFFNSEKKNLYVFERKHT